MNASENKKSVVLVSGGLDSSVTLAISLADGFEAHALSFRYGQRHGLESEKASLVARHLGASSHRFVDLDVSLFGGSALTSDIQVPKDGPVSGESKIPVTYVPARNTVFLSMALAYAESMGAYDIYIGVSSVDYSGYPDCRPEFIAQFERLANLATRAADGGQRFCVHAPLLRMTKGQTVLEGLERGVDFSLTWSCYDPTAEGRPCGRCDSCRLRAKGFAEAGRPDPLLVGVDGR